MPLFYLGAAGLEKLGVPPLAAGRLLAAGAALGIVALAWNFLGICTSSRYAR